MQNIIQLNSIDHVPVLLNEIVSYIEPHENICICDATLGLGGHAKVVIEKCEKLTFVGLDADQNAIDIAKKKINMIFDETSSSGKELFFIHSNFSEIGAIFRRLNLKNPDIIYFDLGTSNMQLKDSERGFSFLKNGPLDMRMNDLTDITAADIVNTYSEKELVRIFSTYGEEHESKTVARAIVQKRKDNKILTTFDLSEIINSAKRKKYDKGKINPATKVFQALRIEVNNELTNIEKALNASIHLLNPGGKILVISFHSLEDRIVKNVFKKAASKCICEDDSPICNCNHKPNLKIITKRPVVPGKEEVGINPKSRSAKLRVGEKI